MSKSLYLECGSGISGDMTVAALLDLGADREVLEKSLESLKLPGYEIAITRVKKSGLDACDFNVILDAEHENHDHDMAYLHGDGVEVHDHPHDHEHHHDHEHAHSHDHDHTGEHHHHHEHRGLPEILAIIRSGGLTPGARALAERIFQILAEAEAKAHGVPLDQVTQGLAGSRAPHAAAEIDQRALGRVDDIGGPLDLLFVVGGHGRQELTAHRKGCTGKDRPESDLPHLPRPA